MATVYSEPTRTGVAATITLSSVTTTSTATSSAIDNSTNNDPFFLIQLKWKTGASGTSTTGLVNVYVNRSADGGTTYDDAKGGDLVGTLYVAANATTYIYSWSTRGILMGDHFKLTVENQGGGTSDTTAGNFSLTYQGIKPTNT